MQDRDRKLQRAERLKLMEECLHLNDPLMVVYAKLQLGIIRYEVQVDEQAQLEKDKKEASKIFRWMKRDTPATTLGRAGEPQSADSHPFTEMKEVSHSPK